VEGALALLLDQTDGRAGAALWPGAPEQGVRVEFLFLLEAVGPGRLALQRYLPPTAVVVAVDLEGRPCEPAGDAKLKRLPPNIWPRLAEALQDRLAELLEAAETVANGRLQDRVQAAVGAAREVLGGEQRRLEELRGLGNVPAAELASHAAKVSETLQALADARVSLDAVRVLVLDPG
jgi:hypothetical protein